MANPDNKGSSGGARPGRHTDAAQPLEPRPNPMPGKPGEVAPVQGMGAFERAKASGRLDPNWAVDVPSGTLPAEAGSPPPPLASYTDESPPRGPDPLAAASASPPAPMGTHPHLADRRRKKG